MATEQTARRQSVATAPRERARTREELPPIEAPVDETRTLSGEFVGAHVGLIEKILYGAFILIGAVMRFWDLGSRALHHDESLHATYSYYLYQCLKSNFFQCITGTNPGGEYHYDPMMHGPYQFHGNALMFLIFGVSNATARFNAAICGTALIALPFLLRRQIGRVAALILAGALAFSPAFLYYSRFTREDIYFALWTFLFFVGLIRWLDARGRPEGRRWLYVAAAGMALAWATFEAVAFTILIVAGFIAGVFVIGYAYQFLAPARPHGKRGHVEVREHPIVSALGSAARANLPTVVDAFRGTPRMAWLKAIGIMALITIVLYWPLGDPWQWGFIPGAHVVPTQNAQNQTVNYNTDFLTGGISYWKIQQGVQRGSQPWYYYFLVIPLYEQVAVVFGAAGLIYYFLFSQRRTRVAVASAIAFAIFCVLALFVGPHLSHLADLALIGLAGLSGVALLVSQPRPLLVNLFLWWTVLSWALYTYAGEKMPWLTLHILLPTYLIAALYLGHLFTARRWSVRWTVTAALLALTTLVSFRSSVALAYADGANPTEMLIYTQTSPDVPMVSDMIHNIPLLPTVGGAKGRVAVDSDSSWPWSWYLHDDPSNHFWNNASMLTAAQQRYPVILIGNDPGDFSTLRSSGKLAQFANYTGYEFKLRWWFPEDYKNWETSGLSGFLGDALRPATWGNIVNWWATRTPFNQQEFQSWGNVTPFYVYVRNDLVKTYVPHDAAWASARQRAARDSVFTAPAQTNDVPAPLTSPITPKLSVNGAALPLPMAAIGAVAVASNGDIYLTDPAAQRIVKLDAAGRYLTSWGSAGKGPGQFGNFSQGPLGIAVDPNGHVYVSDTWNGRVQEFTPQGTFVRAFGHPNVGATATADSFYGPKQVAVAPNGNIYVADTGNERIQVYSPKGAHLFNFGAGSHNAETALGRFDEPSGIAVDKNGTVYVADYWDKRIQRFTLDGKPIAPAFPISGWAVGDYGEPYLAVDGKGHLFATDAPSTVGAHANHVLELDALTGRLLRAFGSTNAGAGALLAPRGVAVDASGALYIADYQAVKLLKVQP